MNNEQTLTHNGISIPDDVSFKEAAALMDGSLELISYGCCRAGMTMKNLNLPDFGSMCLYHYRNKPDVRHNRLILSKLTLPLDRWTIARQCHTANIVRVEEKDAGKGAFDSPDTIQDTDGMYTTCPNILIGVFTADCLGIVLLDPTVPLAAVVHSGWKGTAQAILLRMLETLDKEHLLHPESMQVWFSPSLMRKSLEVGPEVVDAFNAMASKEDLDLSDCFDQGREDRWMADNQLVNIHMLEKFGIPKQNIHPSSIDTLTSPRCYSYRRSRPLDGEHFTFAWIDQPNDGVSY